MEAMALKYSTSAFLLLAILLWVMVAVKSASPQIALPNCPDKCGNISIPYPFGTTERCYRDKSFLITCSNSNSDVDPPRAFVGETNIGVLDIIIPHARVRSAAQVAMKCPQQLGDSSSWNVNLPEIYTLSDELNKFTVVGCNSFASITGPNGTNPSKSACVSLCNNLESITNHSCSGIGCCQSAIHKGMKDFKVDAYFENQTDVRRLNTCTYAFLVEEKSYHFSSPDLNNLQQRSAFPVILDWAIDTIACNEAQKNLKTYACKHNSRCSDAYKGIGYRCLCNKGFQGNPYLEPGCLDVDECKKDGKGCTNVQSDNEKKNNRKKNNRKKKIAIGTGTGLSSLVLAGIVGYVYQRMRDNKLKKKYFRQNGGWLLQDEIGGTGSDEMPTELGGTGFDERPDEMPTELGGTGSDERRDERPKEHGGTGSDERRDERPKELRGQGSDKRRNEMPTELRGTGSDERRDKRPKELRGKGSDKRPKIFTIEELKKATNGFNAKSVIGKGGFGTVYKGVLPENKIVAIKKSKVEDQIHPKQFVKEFIVLSKINHPNVVKLLGCCLETKVPLLVYEFITNGTLSRHIHDAGNASLPWETRLRVASETAGALAHLHTTASPPIIHKDVKPSNILLDENYTAKLSDLGYSRLIPVGQIQLDILVKGTIGYLDPEYLQTNQLTEKSDVYNFGVVLVELLTGEKAILVHRTDEKRNFVAYFISSLKENRLFQILDVRVANEASAEHFEEVAKIAESCLRMNGEERPMMKEVAMKLEELRMMEQIEINYEETKRPVSESMDLCSTSTAIEFGGLKNQGIPQFVIDGGRKSSKGAISLIRNSGALIRRFFNIF